ncbi:MAG: hypothetical protein JO247_08925 [Chloroflexi bacterium]|nr:hypothetical protein [Chloroflexota bacterium]
MLRNAYALIVNDGAVAGLGFVYWIVAARLYQPAQVGMASAIISAMMVVTGVSLLRLDGAMIRFIPQAGRYTSRLVGWSYGISVVASGLGAAIFVMLFAGWSNVAGVLRADWLLGACFILGSMSWCIFALQDSVLTGLRQAHFVPIENGLFGIAKIGLLLAFASRASELGIFGSWIVPATIATIPVNLLIALRLVPRHRDAAANRGMLPDRRQMTRFIAADYVAFLFALLATMMLPIIVEQIAGDAPNGYFYVAWTICAGLMFMNRDMAISVTVEGAHQVEALAEHIRTAARQSVRLVVPVVLLVAIAAPYLLLVFGADYSREATPVLRLLVLGVIPNIAVELWAGAIRVQRKMWQLVALRLVACAIILGLSLWLLPVLGLAGVGIAWLVCQCLTAAVACAALLRLVKAESRPSP